MSKDDKAEMIRKLIEKGTTLAEIRDLVGFANERALRNFMAYVGISARGIRKVGKARRDFVAEQPWQVADHSALSQDELDHAKALGIRPARYAWLLSCPRGGHKLAKLREAGLQP